MVSKEKLYTKLDLLEVELRERLIPHLEKAALGHNDLVFSVVGFSPYSEMKYATDKITEEFVDMGAQILALKKKLGETSEGSLAELICWYCGEWGRTESRHRKTARGLATQFLEDIENGSSQSGKVAKPLCSIATDDSGVE